MQNKDRESKMEGRKKLLPTILHSQSSILVFLCASVPLWPTFDIARARSVALARLDPNS